MFEIKLCRTKAVISVKPVKQITLRLEKLTEIFPVVVQTPVASVLTIDDDQVIVHAYGEIFFKKLRDEARISEIAQEIYRITT